MGSVLSLFRRVFLLVVKCNFVYAKSRFFKDDMQ